jgi:hypothetical protein
MFITNSKVRFFPAALSVNFMFFLVPFTLAKFFQASGING